MTTVTYQNSQKFTQENFTQENHVFSSFLKNRIYRFFFKFAYLLLKLKEMFKCKKSRGSQDLYAK